MLFSQRNGIKALPESLKPNEMPAALRNTLWNVYSRWYSHLPDYQFYPEVWSGFYKEPVDDISGEGTYYHARSEIRKRFMRGTFDEVYDFLEFCMKIDGNAEALGDALNEALEIELAAYRVIDEQFVEVTDELEVELLESALYDDDEAFSGATQHIATALAHLSRRSKPDYRNSIKESISAVEAAAKVVSGKEKATLNDALTVLGKNGKLHGALQKGYSSLYAYTNDANGIRHALMDEPNLTSADAKYFLLSCVSFVNYLKTLSA